MLVDTDFPTESSQHIRTAYSYDAAGRLSCQTVTREAGGTTNLNRTNYTYVYSTAGHNRQLVQEEQQGGMGGWINSSQVTYRYDGMERLDYEKREDWMSNPDPAWVQTYLTVQEYDSRTPLAEASYSIAGCPILCPPAPAPMSEIHRQYKNHQWGVR